ncbi:MAG: methionyl-tRNA formyltransferase [Melioribacteraceae bacterium]|nr:methionyl-tRNA formyltransferase [Melioribacteraceae bacterium]MCF8353984.1 methionyl-tRNA formyltransferase [Melioribacteraceae bacterium]MCF8393712.1 methionyl-tRNA formyltransferase [Melioribacteraceae bacterium]MCF8419546.1 methionyl-tRNA formyltransferase [Melioribacteraceae bacterium]
MKIVFFGTPDFAIPVLEKIQQSKHEICAVVTAPDKERGRGKKISYTPVKQFALDNGIDILQPIRMKDESFISELQKYDADLFVIVAFRILPAEVFTLPKFGSFNLHGSLLPKYRGAAPIQWALIDGEKITGITTFFLKEKVDTGSIILQRKIEIADDDNFGTLHDKMSLAGAQLVIDTIDLIDFGNYTLIEQDNALATPAPKITKEICKIDWNNPAANIHNLIRGLSPHPGAFFESNNKIYKVFKSAVVNDKDLKPGEILETKKEIFIGCGERALQILVIQPEGRKRMTADEFLRGYSLSP